MAPVLRGLSSAVIRCFKRVEHFADWMTGKAGPVFVVLCWALIGLGGLTFFDVVVPSLPLPLFILLIPHFILTPLNLYTHYYLVTHIPPGAPSPRALALSPHGPVTSPNDAWLSHNPKGRLAPERWGFTRRRELTGGMGAAGGGGGLEEMRATGRRVRRCRKCDGPKPERTHHCSVCKRCILLMDHHCPWINACVGLHNQRHFVLFMVWLSVACWTVAALGWPTFWDSFSFSSEWPAWTPKIAWTLFYILSLAIGFAVPVLCSWHLYMVSKGETSIESHDNAYLETKSRAEGLIYLNPYDLGRKRNLQLYFNVGPGAYSKWTLLFPLAIPPTTNGWTYPRRPLPAEPHLKPALNLHAPELADGLVSGDPENGRAGLGRRYVMGDEEGLTDDEEGGGGWMD